MTKLVIASPYINRDVPCRLSLDPPLLNINLEAKTPRKNDEKFLYCSSNVGVINFDTSCIADFERLRDLCLLFEKNNTFSDPVPTTTAYAKKCFPYLMKGNTFPLPVFTELFYFDLINSFSEFCYAESTSVHNSRVFYATFLSNSPMFYPGYINEAITSLRSLLFPPSMTPSKKDLMRLKYFIFYLNYYFAFVSYSHYSKLFPFLNLKMIKYFYYAELKLTPTEKKDLFENLYNEYISYFNPGLTDVSKEYFKDFVTFINYSKNYHFSFPLMSLSYFPVAPSTKNAIFRFIYPFSNVADSMYNIPEECLGHYSLSPLNAACAYEKAKQRKMEDPNFFIPAGEFNKKLINNI